MRRYFMLLALIGAAAAQFEDIEAGMLRCQESCCTDSGGIWDGHSSSCAAAVEAQNGYLSCRNACTEEASGQLGGIGGSSPCCAPMLVLASIFASCALRKTE